jgi:TRAP-type uncharacterized transport system fused permease subunit
MKYDAKISDLLAFSFTIVILIFAASGPLNEFVRWFIEATTADFEELSRREQRMLFKEHWLGAFHRAFERSFLLPTGIILGLPLILSFAISFLNVRAASWLRWIGLALTIAVFSAWIGKLFAVDAGALPSADPIDFWVFPLAVALTLYLTWKQFGSFIIFFCLFWIIYFFVRGWLPEWTGIFAGSDSTLAQSMRAMVLNFWAQTGGLFGQPLQVVSGNVLIFIIFGAVLMASGAGDVLMKIANLLTGRFTGGAAHAAVASSALFGTLSGAAISNVVSTGVMTIPVIKKSGFRPAFAAGVEAAASTGGQIMPPVMGVVAFFVAGQIGLEYRYIVVAAIMPAIFYYVGTFLTVYFEARRQGIGPLPKEARVPLTSTEKRQCLVFIVPLGVLSYYLFAQPSVPKAGFLRISFRYYHGADPIPRIPFAPPHISKLGQQWAHGRIHRRDRCRYWIDRRADRNIRFLGPFITVAIPTCQWSTVCNAHCGCAWVDCFGHGAAPWGHLFHYRHRA